MRPAYTKGTDSAVVGQVMGFNDKANMYNVIYFDLYSPTAPDHFWLTMIKEDDLDYIEEIWNENPYINNKPFKEDFDYRRVRKTDIYKHE